MYIAYFALHYGADFLAWSIRSIQNAVDEIHILYTPYPSFGQSTDLICPETEEQLKKEAYRFLAQGKPLFWHTGRWSNEGSHRNTILQIAKDRNARLILVVDADELWDPDTAAKALIDSETYHSEAHIIRARFIHFWRSLHWACEDPSLPARIINPWVKQEKEWYISPQEYPVLHFGYAQNIEITKYKQDIHGHKNEWRQGWFENKFKAWHPGSDIIDVHPTCHQDFWHPRPTPPKVKELVDKLLYDHPWYGKDLIV